MGVSIVGGDEALIQYEGIDTETETVGETSEGTDDEDSGGMRASTITVKGYIDDPSADEESRRALRNHLRRSLSQRKDSSHGESPVQPMLSISEKAEDVEYAPEGVSLSVFHRIYLITSFFRPDTSVPRQYFVLTDAGKPVFVSNTSSMATDPEALASTIGLMHALISVFIDDGDKLRYVNAGRTRISFLLRSPLYYACVSSSGEPESVVRFSIYPSGKVKS